VLSLLAGYGFLSQINDQYEAQRLKESAIYAQHQLAVDNAQAQLNGSTNYANVDTADLMTQIASYRESNQTLFNTPANNSVGQRTGQTVGQMTGQSNRIGTLNITVVNGITIMSKSKPYRHSETAISSINPPTLITKRLYKTSMTWLSPVPTINYTRCL